MNANTANNDGPRPVLRYVYSYVAQPQLYSDHYPEHQNTPEGVISIAFSRSTIRSVHTSNDLVRGVVLVKSNIKVKSVSIDLVGRSMCKTFEGTTPHKSSTTLFRHGMNLRRVSMPSENCPPNRIEYAFELRFPEHVELAAGDSFCHDDHFEHALGHSLPPSLWWNESTVRNEYVLEAQVLSEEKNFTMIPKVIQQLRFFPSVPEVGIPNQVSMISAPPVRVDRTARDAETRRGSLRRLSRRFSSAHGASEHKLALSSLLVLGVPEYYRAGAKSTLKMSLQTPSVLEDSHLSAVYLRGMRAQAIARIDYRLPVPPHSSLSYNILRSGESKFDLFNRRYAIPGLCLGDATDIETFEINKLVPPTFKTYNVCLSYDVKYDILLNCGGTETEHEVVVKDVLIESMTRPGGWLGPPPEDGATAAFEQSMLRNNIDTSPPAYEP